MFGEGYTALVQMHGRLLAVYTGTDFELYGVNPGGVAVYGATLNEAYGQFVEDLRLALVDSASDGSSFSEFLDHANDIFATTGPRTEARWQQARARARRGELDTDLGLRIESNDPELGISVKLLEHATPAANQAPRHQAPTALAA